MVHLEVWSVVRGRRTPMQIDSHKSPRRDRWVGHDA